MAHAEHEMQPANMLGCEISENPLDPLLPILSICRQHHPDEDMEILSRAYARAVRQHSSQRRKSGEPYIIHPIAVAQILADLGMGPLVVAAGLLHDTVEDTDYTLDECRAEFGDTVTGLVDGVTKLTKMDYGDSAQAETIRKMVVAMSRDVRVLVVKLADRVHNARTWRYVAVKRAEEGARDARCLRAARQPPRHERHQDGARGTELQSALPENLQRDRDARGASRGAARGLPQADRGRDPRRSEGPAHRGLCDRQAEGLFLDLPEDDRARP